MGSSRISGRSSGCPAPEVLAAYIDRGLSLAERARVESHLASCPRCVSVVAGVVRTAEALSQFMPDAGAAAETTPRIGRRVLAGMLTAAAAVIAVLVAPSLLRPWSNRDAGLVSLAETVGDGRSVLGRLTGGFPHAPLGEPSAGGQDGRAAEAARIVQTAGKIRESFGERQTPSRLHELGLSQLLLRRYDDAAQSLLAASREQPDNAKYLSDVSAVQLERARLGLRPDDLPRALAAADRARRLDPSLREAWFNRALATTALSLRDQARQAWADYLARDGSSPWAAEAKAQLDTLSQPTPAAIWPGIEERLRRGIDVALAEEAVRAQTTEARRFLETTLLPAWAAAVAGGNTGDGQREQVRYMAAAFERITGDALYHDAVAAIDRAEAAGSAALLRLARAHRRYAEGAALFEANRIVDATSVLRSAVSDLRAERSAFGVRAEVDLGAVVYVAGRSEEAWRLLSETLVTARSAGYAHAAGRATRFLGMLAMGQGRLGDAEALYEEMLAGFERMGDAEQAALAHELLAALFHYAGDSSSEWRHLNLSATMMSVSLSPAAKYLQMTLAAAALSTESPETALSLQDMVVATAREWGRPAVIVEALTQRAGTRLRLWRRADAEADIAEARQLLSGIDPSFRNRLEVPVLSVESDLLKPRDAEASAATAARAIELVQARGDRLWLAQLSLRLARANIASGRLDNAEAALRRGIQAFDEERASLQDEGKISSQDEAWQLFETAIQLAIGQRDYPRAFALAERARARTLIESRRLPVGLGLADVERSLSSDEAVLALNQFDDELAVWLIRRTGTTVSMRPITRADAVRTVGRQHDEIRLAVVTPYAGAALFNEIVRPFALQLRGVTRLAVVADAPYQDVSFAALWDPAHRRFLVEDFATRMAPSVSLAIGDRRGTPLVPGRAPLVLGGPGPEADAGARAVAAVYRSPELVTGASATASRFFADAPGRSVVHVAARMTSNAAHPLLSRIVMADEPRRRHSGAVLGRDIASRAFPNTDLVVLAEPDPNNREGAGALFMARAFLAAGVPAVVGMLPGIDEASARDVLVGFHRQLAAGTSAEQALTTYQRSVLQSNGRRLGAWSALVLYGSDR